VLTAKNTHLKVSNWSRKRIFTQSAFFIQKLAGFSMRWRQKKAIIEAFFQLLKIWENESTSEY
jgi:hypothetical protein